MDLFPNFEFTIGDPITNLLLFLFKKLLPLLQLLFMLVLHQFSVVVPFQLNFALSDQRV